MLCRFPSETIARYIIYFLEFQLLTRYNCGGDPSKSLVQTQESRNVMEYSGGRIRGVKEKGSL